MPVGDSIPCLGWGCAVFPPDDPLLGGMADMDFALELPLVVLEAGPATALSQAELVDRFVPLAAEEDGDLAEVVRELGGSEARIGKVGDGLPLLV